MYMYVYVSAYEYINYEMEIDGYVALLYVYMCVCA